MGEAKWYLRTQDETFGPETEAKLVEWAKLGRVQPGQEVSDDNVVWTRVEEVPFLDMRFSIDIGDGNPRGPFNKAAADALLASGRLPKTASLVEVRPPFEQPEPEAPEAPEEPEAPQPSEKKREDKEEKPDVAEKPEVRVVEKVVVDDTRVKELEGLLEEERRHTVDLQQRMDDAMKTSSALKATLVERDAQLKAKEAEAAENEKLFYESDAELKAKTAEIADKERALAERAAELKSKAAELAGKDRMIAERDAEIAAKKAELAEKERLVAERDAELKVRTAESAEKDGIIAERDAALKDAEARSAKLSEQVVALEDELKRLPAAASEVADIQAAVFKIMQDEAAVIAATLEREKAEFDECRKRYQVREAYLQECRRGILKMSGRDLEDMTRRALVERPEDPRTTRLRRDYEELQRVHEKAMLDNDARMRQLSDQVRESRAECLRLGESMRDVTQLRAEAERLREALQRAEKDLLSERQRSEELRQREAMGKQALMARLASLESPSIGTVSSMETNQSREAKMVKLPSWMKLRR